MERDTPQPVQEGYKKTAIGIIPQAWNVKAIEDFQPYVTSGSRGWARFYAQTGQPFVRITNMDRSSIYLDMSDSRYVLLPDNSTEGKRTQLKNGDVLISITADIGISSYVDNRVAKPSYINQHIAMVRFDHEAINSKFVCYFLASENVQKLFRGNTDQGAKAGLNLNGVKSIKFAVPQEIEQTAIAKALSDVDALISELEKLIAKKQAIKTATMQQLLTGRTRLPQFALREDGTPKGTKPSELGEVPEDWEIVRVNDCSVKVGSGKTPTGGASVYVDSGRPFIRSQNVVWGKLDLDDVVYITEEVHSSFTGTELRPDDVLLNITGASIGRCAKADLRICGGNVNQHVCIIRTEKTKLAPKLLVDLINSEAGQNQIDSYQSGGNREGLNFLQVRQLSFAIPTSIDEQEAISSVISDLECEIRSIEQRRSKTRQIKQGMMQELLTGRTRLVKPEVQDDAQS